MAAHEATKVLRAAGEATVQVSLGSGVTLGDGGFTGIAGPCALENGEQVEKAASAVKSAGAHVLRGYQRVHVMVRREGHDGNVIRVCRLYREEDLARRLKWPRWSSAAELL